MEYKVSRMELINWLIMHPLFYHVNSHIPDDAPTYFLDKTIAFYTREQSRNPSQQAAAFQSGTSNMPLVLVPRWPKLFHFALNVPSGVYVM